jgi:hypothetical protein
MSPSISLNPSIQIKAIPTIGVDAILDTTQKLSQSLNTDQGNSDV